MKQVTIALAGNPNSGKSSVFNALTGSKQHVGNWPGVTVEKKCGSYEHDGCKVEVVDLPGIYGFNSYTQDEKIARDFLLNQKPDLVIAIVDASNLERNLFLAAQLIEMGNRVVIALNMVDIAKKNGMTVNSDTISVFLGVPVIETIGNHGKGIPELKGAVAENYAQSPSQFKIDFGEAFDSTISSLYQSIKAPEGIDSRFFLQKALEGDDYFLELLKPESEEYIKEAARKLSQETGEDPESFIVEKRYAVLHGLVAESVTRKGDLRASMDLTDKIDRVMLNRVLAIPLFLAIMWGTFQLVFTLGGPIADIADSFVGTFSEWVTVKLDGKVPDLLLSFLTDGIIGGVGAIVVFVPNIFILFLAISILEDSGYMARAAFVMDRLMHLLGLHGRSFIPMILGFGCSVPGVMGCRTLETEKDRTVTILVLPMMSCAARLPVYMLFAPVFFPGNEGSVVFSLYVLGIVLAIILAKVFQKAFFSDETSPLIMELPTYHVPHWGIALKSAAYRSGLFLKKAGTVIMGGVVLIWLLASMPFGVEFGSEASAIGKFGKLIAPIFKPAGFGFWQAGVALVFGVLAKEVVVGTFGTLLSAAEGADLNAAIAQLFTPVSAYAFMIMTLIYMPCLAVIAVIKQELGWKWAWFSLIYSTALGWLLAVVFYQIGSLV